MSLLEDVQCLLRQIVRSQKGSIGSLKSHYLPQLSAAQVDELLKRVDAAVEEENKWHSHSNYVSVYGRFSDPSA